MEWIKVKYQLPDAKHGWSHSERVLVYYEGNEFETECYGIAYYNYSPPYADPGFTDFAHYGRQPSLWTSIVPPSEALFVKDGIDNVTI